jgi:hypothetical protein
VSIPFHPLADLFPLMEDAELDELAADIKRNGLYEKIVLYRGKILDGRNRYNALAKLGISPDRDDKTYFKNVIYAHSTGGEITSRGTDDAAALAYVISKNICRRHLTAEQKRDVIAKLLKAAPEKSNRQVAKVVGVSHPHVAKIRAEMEKAGDVETVTTSIDSKGRKQPAKKPKAKQPAANAAPGEPEVNGAKPLLHCTFCRRCQLNAAHMIVAGDGIHAICDECVDLCAEIVREAREKSTMPTAGDPLCAVAQECRTNHS